jgi:hypothetical protein
LGVYETSQSFEWGESLFLDFVSDRNNKLLKIMVIKADVRGDIVMTCRVIFGPVES